MRSVKLASLGLALLFASGIASAALTLSIELNPNPVRAGETLIAQLTVANNGGAAVNTVVLQAAVPANVNTFNPALMTGGGTCIFSVSNNFACDATELMNWTLGTIPAGGAVTVSVPLVVAAATVAGTMITLPGNVLVNTVSMVTANAIAVVSTTSALSLAVDEDKDRVVTGDTLTYTLTYGNRVASSSVTGTTLSFPVPAGTTFVSATGGGIFAAGSVSWTLGSLPATQSGHQQVVVLVNGGLAPGTVLEVNAATLAGSSGVPESATATAVTRVAASAPLVLGIEFNPDPVRPNEQGVAQLTVTNRGGVALTGVVLQARVPQALNTFNPALLTNGGTCIFGVSNNFACDSSELMNWTLGAIPAGGGITVSVPVFVAVSTAAGRLLALEALVGDDGSNRAVLGATVTVDTDGPLALAVDEDKNPAATGDLLTYTLTYGNRAASSSITATSLNFPVPAGTTFVSATGGGVLSAGSVQWSLGSLLATQSGLQQVVVSVNNGLAAGTVLAVNAATISGLNSSLVTESARATAMMRVASTPPLLLAVEINPNPARPNEQGVAQLTVTNRGGVALTGVVLQARVPQSLNTFNPALLTNGGTCIFGVSNNFACDSAELMNWDLGAIPAGGGVTVSVPVFVESGAAAGSLFVLEALVTDDSSNRAATEATVAIDTNNPLSLSVDDDKNPVAPGNVVTYTLAYGNRALTSSITGTTLNFPIPAGTTFVSATGGGTLSSGKVQWTLGSLAATQSDRQQVVASVNNGLAAGTVIAVNAATISGLNSSLVTESASATTVSRVATNPPLVIGVELNPDPVRPSEQAIAQLTVSNRGLVPLTGVVLQARVPQSLNSFNPALLTNGGTCIFGVSNNFACDSAELMNWDLGTIPAGGGITLSVPVLPAAGAGAGRLLVLETLATDDGINRAMNERAVAVDSDNPLTLAVNENLDAVPGGGVLQYTLTYGNRATTGSVTGATLSFPLPVETVLLGSTGGTIVEGRIVWNLGSLAAGAGGRRMVTLSVPGAVTPGSVVRVDAAELKGNIVAGVVPEAQRATAATRVEASKPLGLNLTPTQDPILAAQGFTWTFTVTNNSGGTLTGVVLQARVPTSVGSFLPALLTGGGTCIFGVSNNFQCDSLELANWNIGTLLNGASVGVTMPLTVLPGTVNGRLITVESRVSDDSGKLSTRERTVLLNPFSDTDADGVAQLYDNCTLQANPTQLDADSDGYGNPCDADLNNSLLVTTADFGLLRSVLNQSATSSPTAAAADLNESGTVTTADFAILRARLNTAPGPSSLAP